MTFWPSAAILALTCSFAPLPIPTMAITAPTPMIIPSMVSAVRSLWLARLRIAYRVIVR